MNSKQGTGKEFSNTEDMIMINIAPYNKKVMVLALASGLLAACSETADLTVEEGTGPEPTLPVPEESMPAYKFVSFRIQKKVPYRLLP
jgi:hypothetical protein